MRKSQRAAIGFGALLAALLTVMPRESAADSAALEKGRKLYEELEYEKAIPALLASAANPLARPLGEKTDNSVVPRDRNSAATTRA